MKKSTVNTEVFDVKRNILKMMINLALQIISGKRISADKRKEISIKITI